jgi:light-regulated signal transduction histidine kinase (bacteriophytochrome)
MPSGAPNSGGFPKLLQWTARSIKRIIFWRRQRRDVLIGLGSFARVSDGRIEVSVVADEAQVTICIADDGVGIPADKREHIFEKFGQIDEGGRHRHSSGIGLTFCRLAVEGHGGRIWADGPKLGGSTFVFTLPIEPPAKTASMPSRGQTAAVT